MLADKLLLSAHFNGLGILNHEEYSLARELQEEEDAGRKVFRRNKQKWANSLIL